MFTRTIWQAASRQSTLPTVARRAQHGARFFAAWSAREELATLKSALENNNLAQARKSFEIMQSQQELNIDRDTFKRLLLLARKGQRQSDLAFVRNAVTSMEEKLGFVPEAFDYHALMYAYGVHERPDLAYNLLKEMRSKGIRISNYTYNTLLGCYKRVGDEEGALRLLDEMEKDGVHGDIGTYNTLLHLVAGRDSTEAYRLYDLMKTEHVRPDAYTYSTMLSIATKDGNLELGEALCHEVLQTKEADINTINNMLAFKSLAVQDLNQVLDLYYTFPQHFPEIQADVVTYNTVLDACLKSGNPAKAFGIYGEMKKQKCDPDVVTYGILINAEHKLGTFDGAIPLFEDMVRSEIQPNSHILSSLASISTQTSDIDLIRKICDIIFKYDTIELDTNAYNSLLSGLAKKGCSEEAQNVYDHFLRHNVRKADIATFTNLILAYVNDNLLDDALDMYYQLKDHHRSPKSDKSNIKLDATFYTTIISALTDLPGRIPDPTPDKLNYNWKLDDGRLYLDDVDDMSQPHLVMAATLFADMRNFQIQPNAHVYTSMLHACAKFKDERVLEDIHRLLRMDLYFDPDTGVYNALMNAYNHIGDGRKVLEIWDILSLSTDPKTSIDSTTVSIVLDSCGHNGYGYLAHNIMQRLKHAEFPLNTQVYSSYVECLCRSTSNRSGWDSAKRVIEKEMRPVNGPISDSRPVVDEKTINTLLSFAKKKGFDLEEYKQLENWKKELLGIQS